MLTLLERERLAYIRGEMEAVAVLREALDHEEDARMGWDEADRLRDCVDDLEAGGFRR